MDYVPENGNAFIDEILKGLDIDMQKLLDLDPRQMVLHIQNYHFDWDNAEQFADFLTTLSAKLPEEKFALTAKAIAIYNYIQRESKTFSFTIAAKINLAKN